MTITGGRQPEGGYRWVVENHSSTPVVSVEFPHYRADQFHPPPGWKSESTYLVNVGVEDRPGTCRAWPGSPRDAIPPSGNASFVMRVRQLEASHGTGAAKVGLADGTTIIIQGVEVPTVPGSLERFGVLVTFSILFTALALFAARRRRSRRLPTTPPSR